MTPVSLAFLSVPPKSCVSAVAVTPRNKAAAITTPIERLMSFLLSCCARMHGSSNLFRRGVDRLTEALDDRVDCAIIDDERRRDQHVVAALAVHCAAHGLQLQDERHCFKLYERIQLTLLI